MVYNAIQETTNEGNQFLNVRNALITSLIALEPSTLKRAELGIQYCNLLLNETDDCNKQIITLLQGLDNTSNEKEYQFW